MKTNINETIKQAISAHKLGKFNEAIDLYKAVLQILPKHLGARHNIGIIFQSMGKFREAEDSFKKVLLLKPDLAVTHLNLGGLLNILGRLEEAEVSVNNAIKFQHNFPEAFNSLAIILNGLYRTEEAEQNFKKAIELKPDYAEAYNNLGVLLNKIGRLKEAELNYLKATELKSDYVMAHYNLCQIKTYIKEDEQFYIMKNLYLDENLINHHRCHLSFALAKAYEDLNQIDNSFKFYSDGNALRKKMLNYNIHQDIEYFDQLKKSCLNIKKNSLKNVNLINNPRPIFIIGMPRSGTTLIEQIISSHSNVTGAGELEYLAQFGEAIAIGKSKVDSKTLNLLRENYLKKLKEVSQGKLMVIDKMPGNFRYIALINSAFPDAKIIHVKRNPAATCWGNYKRLFVSKNGYSFDLDDLTTYYELYENLMHFWEDLYSDQIYNLNYETLVKNQEDETKKLIQHLGLKWQDECLKPENNKRIVHTASTLQVRRKVFQGSSEKWKKFEPFLNGVFNHFEN